jgi:hypothetical protein
MTIGGPPQGGGISGFDVAEEEETPLSGTGGAAGGGTRAGEGDPSGEGTARDAALKDDDALATPDNVNSAGELAGRSGSEAAEEVAALGSDGEDHDKIPALEYGEGDRPRGPTIGEALGSGAGTHVGSGTPDDDSIGGGTVGGEAGED